jgi:hypothetical protein
MDFCAIAPTSLLPIVDGRNCHLTLAHLIEKDEKYCQFYRNQKQFYGSKIIMDNSAFELAAEQRPMYTTEQIIELALKVNADEIVLIDYPYEHHSKTILSAYNNVAKVKASLSNVSIMFVPQSLPGDIGGLIAGFKAGAHMIERGLINRIGVSILAVPNALGIGMPGCTMGKTRLELFMARYNFLHMLEQYDDIYFPRKSFHMLGLIDGPNEIRLMHPFSQLIGSWDSSSPVWAGVKLKYYDESATGLVDGKIKTPVDFDFVSSDQISDLIFDCIEHNLQYINELEESYNGEDDGFI